MNERKAPSSDVHCHSLSLDGTECQVAKSSDYMIRITQTQFRILLTLSIATLLASVVIEAMADTWLLPQELRDYVAADHKKAPKIRDVVVGVLGIPPVVGSFIAIFGLYRFRSYAPRLALASWVYGLIWMPFSSGVVIETPLGCALSQCSTFLAGAVLALVYFSPAAEWFSNNGSSRQQGEGDSLPATNSETTQVSEEKDVS